MRRLLFLGLSVLLLALQTGAAPLVAPQFILLDPAAMAAYKAAYKAGGTAEKAQVARLLNAADQALARGPYSIATKPQVPPSGDKHDYISQAPYWWADPTKPDGKPYIVKDGLRNPESAAMKDSETLSNLCHDVQHLALGYYFSADEKYATHAARLLHGFFLDPATRMNPNLNFGQGIPGQNTGRSFGIIESRHLVEIPDALALLSGSKSVDATVAGGVKKWFADYLQWLRTSKNGQEEGGNKNNHGTFHDVQAVNFALFTGDKKLARQLLETYTLPRIPVQFAADGSQPLELARTRPWNYVSMNLQGWVQLAVMAPQAGIDLWHYRTADGRGLEQAVTWFRPYLLREKQMERADAVPAGNTTMLLLYHRAQAQYPALGADAVFALYPEFARTPWAI